MLKAIPCSQDCPDRSPTCHAKCERYARYVDDCAKRRAKERADSDIRRPSNLLLSNLKKQQIARRNTWKT